MPDVADSLLAAPLPPMPESFTFLAVLPSSGLGGGIEAYGDRIIEAVGATGAAVHRVSLVGETGRPTSSMKLIFAVRVALSAYKLRHRRLRLLIFHADLLPVVPLAWLVMRRAVPTFVFFHGAEIGRPSSFKRLLLSRPCCRLVAVSSFTAGALSRLGSAFLVRTFLSQSHLDALDAARKSTACVPTSSELRLLSVFRLSDAENKGAPVLIEACDRLRDDGVVLTLTIAGKGPIPERLTRLQSGRPWLSVVPSPSFDQLAAVYSAADLFVLATIDRVPGRSTFVGEGLGIVLLEAQAAGLPVVVPFSGGSSDAFVNGYTGVRPIGPGARALADSIGRMVPDDVRDMLGRNARRWVRQRFGPEVGHAETCAVLFAEVPCGPNRF